MTKHNDYLRFIESESDYERVRTFFNSMSDDFFPALSQRSGEFERYLEGPMKNGKIAIFERDERIVGSVAYMFDKEGIVIELIGVEKDLRRSPIFYRLAEYIFGDDELDLSGRAKLRTWSTNYTMKTILKKGGLRKQELFQEIYTLRGLLKYMKGGLSR